MNKYILYSHDGSKNHGCEALVRSTIDVIGAAPEQTVLISSRPDEDVHYGIDNLCKIIKYHQTSPVSKKSIAFLKAYWRLKVHNDYEPLDYLGVLAAVEAKRGDIGISIGGDTYCYGGTKEMAFRNRVWKYGGLKTVFWGCSVEPALLEDSEIVDDISSFDLITARETISYKVLKQINPSTILVPDTAFFLKAIKHPLPCEMIEKKFIGINLSPMAESREMIPGITRANYVSLIEHILYETQMNILLVPHVIWPDNDDRVPLNYLYDKYKSTNRVFMVDDCNCMELKGYIGRCRIFIGSRTHATIAAYSSCIPTLAVGYSIKARGIARDLFGTEEHFLLPVQELSSKDDLKNAFDWIYEHEVDIKKHLEKILPKYKRRIEQGVLLLKKL